MQGCSETEKCSHLLFNDHFKRQCTISLESRRTAEMLFRQRCCHREDVQLRLRRRCKQQPFRSQSDKVSEFLKRENISSVDILTEY